MVEAHENDHFNEQPPTPPADEADLMRQQVQARIVEAAAAQPAPPAPPPITSELVQQCLFANELGDGTLYATLFRDKLVYCCNSGEWSVWAGHFWQRDTTGRALCSVEKVAGQYLAEHSRINLDIVKLAAESGANDTEPIKKMQQKQASILKRVSQLRGVNRRRACLEFAHSIENPISCQAEEFDAHPWLFACANGVIDLRTGVLKPGRPSDYLSQASPIKFLGIDTPAALWEKSLIEIFNNDGEIVAYIQRLFGYCMTGIVKEKVFPMLWGKSGWNGRSLIVETIARILGDLSVSVQAEMLLTSKNTKNSSAPSPDVMQLKGRRLAFASEIDENQRFSVSKIKLFTGADTLPGRNPHDKFTTNFRPTHKLMVQTNVQPAAPAADRSFWERMHLIPFEISFVNRDPQEPHERRANLNLGKELQEEAPGILAWLVRGCLLWQQQGLQPPVAVTEASRQYRLNEDTFLDFADECLEREPFAKETAKALNSKFGVWFQENIENSADNHPCSKQHGKANKNLHKHRFSLAFLV